MKNSKLVFIFLFFSCITIQAQISEFEVKLDGIVIPRVDRTTVTSPDQSQLIWDINGESFWYYKGSDWTELTGEDSSSSLIIDQDGDSSVDIESSPDVDEFSVKLEGQIMMKVERNLNGIPILAFYNGENNLFIGENAGLHTIASGISTGEQNIAIGNSALNKNLSGNHNVAIGQNALSTGYSTPRIGNGNGNIAIGKWAQGINQLGGDHNIAIGNEALYSNAQGDYNIAIGYNSMRSGGNAQNSVAIGRESLRFNSGNSNVAIGHNSGKNNTTGPNNTFVGDGSGYNNKTGLNNTIVGQLAGYNTDASYNTYVGRWAGLQNYSGSCNTALGFAAGSANGKWYLTNTTAIGYEARAAASNRVRIGNDNVTEIGGIVGWSILSDGRFKTNVTEDVKGLVFIKKLNPVTYNLNSSKLREFNNLKSNEYSSSNDISAIKFSGFIAQEVEKAAASVAYDFSGIQTPKSDDDTYALRYSDFVVPLVKAVQELSDENDFLKGMNTELESKIVSIMQRLERLEKR